MLPPPSNASWTWHSRTYCTSAWLYTLMISLCLVRKLTSTCSTCDWSSNGYVRKSSWQSGRSVNLVKLVLSSLAILLKMEQCTLTLTKSTRCKLSWNQKMSRKCSSLWDWQITMLNTFVILLILPHYSHPWCHLSGNGFGVPTRMWRLTGYGSSYVTYHVAL